MPRNSKVEPNHWGCCDTPLAVDQVEYSDFRLTTNGRVLAVTQCPQGHQITNFLAPKWLTSDDPEARRTYVMGAAIGYRLGHRKATEWLIKAVLEMGDWLPRERICTITGWSEAYVYKVLTGQYPAPLEGEYAKAADRIFDFAGGGDE